MNNNSDNKRWVYKKGDFYVARCEYCTLATKCGNEQIANRLLEIHKEYWHNG